MASPSPYAGIVSDKLCECGCGEFTLLAPYTSSYHGTVAGTPNRYVRGHVSRAQHKLTWTVDGESGCWNVDHPDPYGYRRYWRNGEHRLLHRDHYEQAHGPIPKGWHVHHKCENRACVNPDHLEAISPREHASRHHAPLDPEDRAEVLRLHSVGVPPRVIAPAFCVSRSYVSTLAYRYGG